MPSIPTATSSRDSTTPTASVSATASSVASPSGASGTPEVATANPRLTSPRGVPPPQTPAPLAIRTDLVLENALKLVLGEELNGYGVVAIDLESGRSASINGDLIFYSASIFKTWVMYEVFHQASLNYFNLTDQLVMTPYYDSFGLGPRATRLCQRLTVQQALEAMMSISDNSAAVLLQDLVGAPNVNSSLEALGLKDSRLNTEDIPVTANDMALLLQFIGSGKAVNREASEAMAALMLTEGFNNGLTSGVPSDVQVAHKTGNWPNARHDIGIVFAPETTYVVAVLSDNRAGSLSMIQAISTAVYDSFNR
jgi:beta-lactamase class A